MTRTRAALAAVFSGLLITLATVTFPSSASAAELEEVTNFGDNPSDMEMHIYVPDSVPDQPAIMVAMHGCSGSGPDYAEQTEFTSLADQHGFIVVYPTATNRTIMGNCFDVWSEESKHRGGGSDPVSIVSMVTYAQQEYGGDPDRVFATGSSSGGMETNALLALYPDVFAAGTVYMGVPFTCFVDESDFPPFSSECTGGERDQTPQAWGDAVREAHPGYSGPRPRVQLWHGDDDPLVPYQLLDEEVEQWTDVFALSQTPTSTDQPQPGWTRQSFADPEGNVQVESITAANAGHDLPRDGMAAAAVTFFGLDSGT